jgi:hypothetical protein
MNDHNIEIGIAGVGLLIGLCGVFFQTRHEGKKGIASITKWGWLSSTT